MQQEDARHYGPKDGSEGLRVIVRKHRQSLPGGRGAVISFKETL